MINYYPEAPKTEAISTIHCEPVKHNNEMIDISLWLDSPTTSTFLQPFYYQPTFNTWNDRVDKKIKEFEGLTYNWNGNRAKPFNKTLLDKAKYIITSLNEFPEPEIFPTAQQSIQFEYSATMGAYLEFEIFEDKIIGYKEPGEYELENLTLSEITDILKNFFSKTSVAA